MNASLSAKVYLAIREISYRFDIIFFPDPIENEHRRQQQEQHQ